MSMRKHLIKKIIREELAAAAKQRGKQRKILSEGLKTPEPTMHEPATNKAIRSRTAKSDSTSFIDPPNANLDRGDGRGRYFVEEAADEGDRKEFGVGLDGHIEHVPGYPTEDDHEPSINETVDPREEEGTDELGDPLQRLDRAGRRPLSAVKPFIHDQKPSLKGQLSETQIHRWKKLARINEQDLGPDLGPPPEDMEAVYFPEGEGLPEPEGAPGLDIDDMDTDIDVEPPQEPEIDFEDPDFMFAGEEGFDIEGEAEEVDLGEMGDMGDLGAIEAGLEGIPEPIGGGIAHRDDDSSSISLRIREEITRILKEKL